MTKFLFNRWELAIIIIYAFFISYVLLFCFIYILTGNFLFLPQYWYCAIDFNPSGACADIQHRYIALGTHKIISYLDLYTLLGKLVPLLGFAVEAIFLIHLKKLQKENRWKIYKTILIGSIITILILVSIFSSYLLYGLQGYWNW